MGLYGKPKTDTRPGVVQGSKISDYGLKTLDNGFTDSIVIPLVMTWAIKKNGKTCYKSLAFSFQS